MAIPALGFWAARPLFMNAADVYAEESRTATGSLTIPAIGLEAPVAKVSLDGKTLTAPEQIAGSFSQHQGKTLLIGHSSTIFSTLHQVQLGDKLTYNDHVYTVSSIETKLKSDIDMADVLKSESKDTVILMTCSGEPLGGQDYSHRLIITAN